MISATARFLSSLNCWGGPPASSGDEETDGPCPAYAATPRSLMEPPIAGRENRMWRNEGEQFGSAFSLTDQD